MAWKEVKLKELISEMGDGGTPTTTEPSNFGGDIPWVVVDDVVSKIRSTKESLTDKGFKGCSAKKWPIGSVILTTGATIGQVGIAEIELCTKQGITGIVVNNYANAEFLKFWFESNTKQLLRFAQGTTFKEIRPRTLGNLRIQIPNPFTNSGLAEQTAIATLLSKVDEAIAATQNSIKAAEKLKKALMQNLLTGKLKPDGSWRSEDEFYEDEKFGKVPLGWEWKRIKNITSEVQYGLNISSVENGSDPMFRMNNIVDGKMVSSPMVYVNLSQKEFEKYKVKKGDILFNRTNSLDLVGKVGIYELDETDFVFASYLIRLRIDEENDPHFINHFLNSYTGQCSLRSKATPAVSQANINAKSLRNTFVLCPTKDEQIEIVLRLNSIEVSKNDKQTKIQTLQRLKKSLMQNLLTGKVRLPQEFISQFEEVVEEVNKTVTAQ